MLSLKNQRGIALLTALMFTLIALAIVMAAMYLVTQGIQVSAANKRYKNALEAAQGGAELFTGNVIPQGLGGYPYAALTSDLAALSFKPYTTSLKQKLVNPTSNVAKDPTILPDATFTLKGSPAVPSFNVYTKIVNTVPGNSDTSGEDQLDSIAGVAYANNGGGSAVNPMHIPSQYMIEIEGQKQNNPKEKAKLSVLYAY